MQLAQNITSLALSLRKKEMIRVRQPLQKIMIPVLNSKMQEDIEEFKCLVEIQKEEMEQFKKNEYALKCKTEQQFDSMYQTFTKDFVLLRHAKKQQAKAHTFEIERRDRAEKVLKAKTAQQFDKMYETLVRDIAMKDHEIAQLQTQLSAYEDDLKEKEKMMMVMTETEILLTIQL